MNQNFRLYAILFILLFSGIPGKADDLQKVKDLRGYWKFSIGDDAAWADPRFDDSSWEEIRVPSSWENEGFHGYNGYAWYRTKIELPSDIKDYTLYLQLGFIDDVDEVYLNGTLIGSTGTFPPEFNTAYNAFRNYIIPPSALNSSGVNTIAVRVYDSMLEGGIINGDIGIYTDGAALKLAINLTGSWKFKTGDNKEWKSSKFDDATWNSILVPSYWEAQGYKDYDGFAWYRRTVTVKKELLKSKLVLVLGKIDDIDEVFINGRKVGATGEMFDDPFFITYNQEYAEFRGYYLTDDMLKEGINVIAVRVYDGYKDGGIYQGPVGIVKQSDYRRYWKEKNSRKSIWDIIFDR